MKTKSNWGGIREGAGPKRKSVKLSLDDLAATIYIACFGHLDDKRFRAEKQTEILDWLKNGDLDERPNLQNLIDEWREYDKDDPNLK